MARISLPKLPPAAAGRIIFMGRDGYLPASPASANPGSPEEQHIATAIKKHTSLTPINGISKFTKLFLARKTQEIISNLLSDLVDAVPHLFIR